MREVFEEPRPWAGRGSVALERSLKYELKE